MVNSERIEVMVNSDKNTTTQISMDGQQLEEKTIFKYLGPTLWTLGRGN